MSHSQFHSIDLFILRHAWLNLWDKHMTTGRINQITTLSLFSFLFSSKWIRAEESKQQTHKTKQLLSKLSQASWDRVTYKLMVFVHLSYIYPLSYKHLTMHIGTFGIKKSSQTATPNTFSLALPVLHSQHSTQSHFCIHILLMNQQELSIHTMDQTAKLRQSFSNIDMHTNMSFFAR